MKGQRDGKGMKIDEDHITIGYYLKDKIHGQCTTYFCDGSKAIQRFKEGVKHGEQLFYSAVGKSQYEMYKDGVQTNFSGVAKRRGTLKKDA
jgi:antitoxin component YwqK of YwqJK toxin-antitoxin module